MKHAFSIVAVLLLTCTATAQQPPSELAPITAKLPAGEVALSELLAALNQTGNTVHDRRKPADNPKLAIAKNVAEFWPALDLIGEKTGIAFSAYQPNGGVALIDRPYRKLPTSYAGIFRFAVKRTSVTLDDETQTRHCTVTLDIAWEPRFQPFYLNLEQADVRFAPDAKGMVLSESVPRQTRSDVSGACATEIDLRMMAPPRSSPAIASLTGTISVIGPAKMLDFAFEKLTPIKKGTGRMLQQDGVNVSLTHAELSAMLWTVDVELVYPPDALGSLESFQAGAWRANNRIWLRWIDPRTKEIRKLEQSSQATLFSKSGTKIRYHFEASDSTSLPPRGIDVALVYRTPSRVVSFTAPFAFRDLPLP